MPEYAKNVLPREISVHAIVTVKQGHDFSKLSGKGGETHDFWEFVYVRRGTHRVLLGDRSVTQQVGEMLFYPPNVYHGTAPEPSDALVDIVSFAGEFSIDEERLGYPFLLNAVQKEQLDRFVKAAAPLLRPAKPADGVRGMVLREGAGDEKTLQRLRGWLELFLLDLTEERSAAPTKSHRRQREQLACVAAYLSQNIDKPLSLAEIGDACAMSVSGLKNLFRRECDCGVLAYFLHMKIERAKEWLATTPLTVEEVADRLGFSSANYFSKLFKKKTGVTPTEYAAYHSANT